MISNAMEPPVDTSVSATNMSCVRGSVSLQPPKELANSAQSQRAWIARPRIVFIAAI
jgi:hypothetical protein